MPSIAKMEEYNILLKFLDDLDLFHGLSEFAEFLTDKVNRSLGAENSQVFMRNFENDTLDPVWTSLVLPPEGGMEPIPVNESTVPGKCAISREVIKSGSGVEDLSTPSLAHLSSGPVRSFTAFPVMRHGRVMAVLAVVNFKMGPAGDYGVEIKELLALLPHAVSYLEMKDDLAVLEQKFAELAGMAVESVTPEGPGHVMRVTSVCSQLSALLDFSPAVRRKLWGAALFHDLGKLLLFGQEPWEVERFHTVKGAEYLRGIKAFREFAPIVETSHERYDGTGFPNGLAGDDIPLENWALALAEDLEEFRHENRSLTFEDMFNLFLARNAESHHPNGVEALTTLFETGRLGKIG